MDRLILTETVRHEGRDFKGCHSCLTLEPARNADWVWRVNGCDVPITPSIMKSKPRRVALMWSGFELNEFEHIGILRAAGLRGVRISLQGSTWPPYDGGSFALWQKVIPQVRKSGELTPYRLEKNASATLPTDKGRSVSYYGDGNDQKELRTTGVIHFPGIHKDIRRFGHRYPTADIRSLVRARTLGWPAYLKPVSWLASQCGWPHHEKILWPYDAGPEEVLEEIGRHRLLDALSIINFLAPAEHYLAGSFHTVKGNHETDLLLMTELASSKVLPFVRSAA